MADTLTLAIATAVASKSAEKMTEQAQQAIADIVQRIREKLATRHQTRAEVAILESAIDDDGSATEPLARILDREFTADPSFRDEIRALWGQAASVNANYGVLNVFTGTADKVTQLGNVGGDLTIN